MDVMREAFAEQLVDRPDAWQRISRDYEAAKAVLEDRAAEIQEKLTGVVGECARVGAKLRTVKKLLTARRPSRQGFNSNR